MGTQTMKLHEIKEKRAALVTDEDGRTGDLLADFVLALAAEGAVKRVLALATVAADFAHFRPRITSYNVCYTKLLRR